MRPFVVFVYFLAMLFSLTNASGQTLIAGYECRVNIDIQNVTKDKDRVKITIYTPPIKSRHVRYVMPAYLPGMGNKVDNGQFVHEFYALDDRGMPIKAVKRQSGNVILLKLDKGRTLRKLEYWVDDSWGESDGKDYHNERYSLIPNAAGTTFEQGKGFLLNPAYMFGYFEGYSWIPYRVSVLHNEAMFPFSSLSHSEVGVNRDEFLANSYNDLIEYPIYYGEPDTCGFVSRNVYIDIAVVTDSGAITARQIRKYIGAQVSACTRFIGDIPPCHYKMLFFFTKEQKGKAVTNGVFGGASHRSSAVYYLQETDDEDQIIAMVTREISGDLLKMISFLDQSRSGDGNFLRPQVTASWWMTEGMKSYFSWLADIRDSVSNEADFMAALSAKIRLYEDVKNKSLTDVEQLEKSLKNPLVAEKYRARAMLTVFMLDINITQWTGGLLGLREIVLALNDSARFTCDSLEAYIEQKVTSQAKNFCASYCSGNKELPMIESMSKIGWVYSPTALDSVLTFGQISLYYDEIADAFFVRQAEQGNRLMLENGDRLVSIDGTNVDAANLDVVLATIYSPQDITQVEVIFIRGNQNERITASPFFRTVVVDHIVRFDPAGNDDAELLHARIFSPYGY